MECGLCGTANREGARFCGGCGSPLPRQCATCKAELEPGLRFCDQCGTPVEEPATATATAPPRPASGGLDAVRKTVTVLFADLGGSTGFGERTDPEVSRQVLARYHALLQDAIDAHRGTVAKFMGDGMMATFGIPGIAEDDAERAVRAGIDIQDRFERFATEVTAQYGETLTARVGVNTGEVVIGAGDADLVGDALNVAARLEKACRPGHVLVGDETWRLTRGVLAYESLGEVTVAGRAEPVGTYEVAASETRTAEPVAPFVGRDSELERLLVCLGRARTERTAVLATVLGSPGLGKTRLSRELATHAGDAATFEIRCDRAGGSTFAPIADLVRTAAGLEDTESDADGTVTRARIAALLEGESDGDRIVDVLAGVLGAAPARSVEETFWAVRRTLEALAAEQPLLVVVDDIQWAEPKLLDLLEHLGEWLTDAPVLLVALARPELRELRPSLVEPGRRVADVVALDGLDSGATEALAAGLLGSALPRELVDRLPVSTDGNPLFVRELVRMLVDDRVIRRRDDGTWELSIDADAVEVPPTIQSLLSARVERLPADELRVLELASVVGAEFSVGALRELAGEDLPIPLLLERLRRKELVEPTGAYWGDEPIHRFHHVLIRDAAYRRLLKGTRADLHQRIGEWTDATSGQVIGEHETAIAFHYEQAHRYRTELGTVDEETDRLGRRAAELLGVAARRALDRDDLAAAGALVRRALAVLPMAETATRSELLLMACECLLASGDVAAGAPLVDELSELGATDEQLGAWAACFRAQLVGLTDAAGLVDAEAAATAAADTLRSLGDGAGEAKAQQVRALLLARLGRVGEAEAVLDLALGAARAVDDRRRVTAVLGAAPQAALFGPSPVARAGGRCLDVVRLLRITTASPSVEATSMRCQAVLEALRGRFDVSRSMLASARASLEELGLRHGLLETDLFTGMVELLADDPRAAVAPLRAAYEGLDTLGVGADAGQAAALLATALLEQGEIDEAELIAAASEALAGQNLKTAIAWRTAKAAVLAARGELAAAVALARKAVDIAAATDLVLDHADACVVLANLREQAGDTTGARDARAEALRLYEAKGATVPAERLEAAMHVPIASPAAPEPPAEAGRRLDNTATRVVAQLARYIGSGQVPPELVSDDLQLEDRRSLVSIPGGGGDEIGGNFSLMQDQGFEIRDPEPVAIRGERLALHRTWARTPAGDETTLLSIDELDGQLRIAALTWFDEDDLQTALDELDERYLAGEGADDAWRVRAGMRAVALAQARDLDGYRDALHPGLRFVDHRPLGFPESDRDGLIEIRRSFPTNMTPIVRSLDQSGHASMVTMDITVPGDAGGGMQWSMLIVSLLEDDGLVRRIEWFAPDDHAAAFARMQELGEPRPAGPVLENSASRLTQRTLELAQDGRWDELQACFSADFTASDHRPVTGDGVARGAREMIENLRHIFGMTTAVSWTVEAIRGDRLVLARMHFVTDGFEVAALHLGSIDADGRSDASETFADDDLAAAVLELDRRYVAGEGAPYARVLRVCGAFHHASIGSDVDRVRALLSPDMKMVDHREIGLYTGDLQHYLAMASREEFSSVEIFTRTLEIVGSTVLATHEERLQTRAGSDYDYGPGCTLLSIGPDDRIARMEWWPGDRYEEARARLHELERPVLRLDNAATRAALASTAALDRYLRSGERVPAGVEFASDFAMDDRRAIVAMPTQRRGDLLAVFDTMRDQGYFGVSDTIVAIRGDRLCLAARTFTTASVGETTSLSITELDEHGRLRRVCLFGTDQLDAALAELDTSWLRDEGAPDAEVLVTCARFAHLAQVGDYAGQREMMSEDFVVLDHQPLGFGTGDRDYLLDAGRNLDALAGDSHRINRAVWVDGRALLALNERHLRTDGGSEYLGVSYILLVVDDRGLVSRFELFAEDQHDEAIARLHELGAPPTTSFVLENAATRTNARQLELINADDWVAAGELDAVAADVVRVDRRKLVSAPPIEGRENFGLNAAAFLDVFDHVEPEVVAIRGERSALVRLHCGTPPDFVLRILCLYEFDEDGRLTWEADYDDEDLADALAELDQRFLVGEGAAHERVIRICLAFGDANERRDFDAMRDMLAADFVMDDRTSLGYGEGDRDYFDVSSRTRADVSPADGISINRLVQIDGNALLTLAEGHHITPEGSDYAWVSNIVFQVGDDGLIHRAEYFDEGAFATAVERLHELGAPAVLPLENRASRLQQTVAVGDSHRQSSTDFFTPDFRFEDRRSVVNLGSTDAAGLQRNLAMMREQGYVIQTPEIVAIRGERLSLARRTARTPSGDESVVLAVGEIDDTDRYSGLVFFDADDLDAALDELDERFAAGEGADHAFTIQRLGDFRHALAARDWDAFEALFSPGLVAVDRRQIGLGAGDRDAYVASTRAMIELVPDVRVVFQSVECAGDALLARTLDAGTGASGGASEWQQYLVVHQAAGLVDRIEAFSIGDEAMARTRFAEVANAPRGPMVDNRLVRITVRRGWTGRFVGIAQASTVYAPDVVLDDRRAAVNAGEVAGPDEVAASIDAGTEVFGALVIVPMAVRGEGLGLFHWAYRQEGGFEAPGLSVIEMDEHDLTRRVTSFDESDLADAIDFLEARHRELAGDSYTWIDGLGAEGERALNHRDFDAFGPLLAPEFTVIDHRPFGVPMDRAEYLENLRVLIEQAPDFTFFFADVRIEGDVAITVVPFFGTTPEGNRYEWSYVQVAVGRDGQATAFEFFDDDQWDEALARFEELVAADRGAARQPAIGNAATRLIADASSLIWTDLEAALDLFAPDAAGAARESGPSRDLVATNREMWRDVLSSFANTYDEVHFTPLAVRGELLALLRQEFVVDGYASPNLTVLAIDEQGRIRIIETFGDDEMDRAVARLDELEHPRTPAIDNAALRTLLRTSELRADGELEAAGRLIAPDVTTTDHRATAPMPDSDGRSEFSRHIRKSFEVFDTEEIEPIAVRGERAVLFRVQQARDGFAVTFLGVWLVDEQHRLVRGEIFEESDLVGALAALEAQHLELLGDRATGTERAFAEISALINRRDPELFESCLVPDVTIVDHLPLSFPPASRASDFTRMLHRLYELAPDTVFMTTKVYVEARASLAVSEQRSTTPDGNRYTWTRIMVSRYAPDGRVEEQQYFPEDRWDDAVALFDDWTA